MSSRNKSFFSAITEEASKQPVASREKPEHLSARVNRLSQIANQDIIEKTEMLVLPERCRMWAHHNRRYDLLNETACADLISSFKAQGRQEIPGIVRRVDNDPAYDYEVICGARRHWTVSYLRQHNYTQFKFLVEVRQLSDEEAFRMSDLENRDKLDISDYERAVDYKKALGLYYNTQKEMAERLQVTVDWLSRYLALADLPDLVVNAYPSVNAIRTDYARRLAPVLSSRETRERALKVAQELNAKQKEAREKGVSLLDGKRVTDALVAVAGTGGKSSKKQNNAATYQVKGNTVITVEKVQRTGFTLRLAPKSVTTKEDLKQAFEEFLAAHYQ